MDNESGGVERDILSLPWVILRVRGHKVIGNVIIRKNGYNG